MSNINIFQKIILTVGAILIMLRVKGAIIVENFDPMQLVFLTVRDLTPAGPRNTWMAKPNINWEIHRILPHFPMGIIDILLLRQAPYVTLFRLNHIMSYLSNPQNQITYQLNCARPLWELNITFKLDMEKRSMAIECQCDPVNFTVANNCPRDTTVFTNADHRFHLAIKAEKNKTMGNDILLSIMIMPINS